MSILRRSYGIICLVNIGLRSGELCFHVRNLIAEFAFTILKKMLD